MKLHRSLGFWGGLLVMGAIVWGWWDSQTKWTAVGHTRFLLSQRSSAVAVFIRVGSIDKTSWQFIRLPFVGTEAIRPTDPPKLMIRPNRSRGGGHKVIFEATHFVLLVTSCSAWLAYLAWRRRGRVAAAAEGGEG